MGLACGWRFSGDKILFRPAALNIKESAGWSTTAVVVRGNHASDRGVAGAADRGGISREGLPVGSIIVADQIARRRVPPSFRHLAKCKLLRPSQKVVRYLL
jgi:hypothetical protein